MNESKISFRKSHERYEIWKYSSSVSSSLQMNLLPTPCENDPLHGT